MIAERLANMKRGDNQHAQICATSQAEAAKLLNVSRRSVQRAMIAERLANLGEGRPKKTTKIFGVSQSKVGEYGTGYSHRPFRNFGKVIPIKGWRIWGREPVQTLRKFAQSHKPKPQSF